MRLLFYQAFSREIRKINWQTYSREKNKMVLYKFILKSRIYLVYRDVESIHSLFYRIKSKL